MAIERYVVRPKPVTPPSVLRTVFEGDDAKVIDVLLRTNVTVPAALRRAGLKELADQLYEMSQRYCPAEVEMVDA